jgi:hypothetical protein
MIDANETALEGIVLAPDSRLDLPADLAFEDWHERHCTATTERPVCPPLCVAARALIARAELI